MISILGLTKRFGDFTAVDNVNLDVNKGEVFGFLGPNGAGKTTTIRMLMGILASTRGTAAIDGLDCFKDRVEVKRIVGYLPDEPAFYDYLRGREILAFVGRMHGLSKTESGARAMELLEELGIADASEEYAANYSTGMKKRLALACAFIHDPDALILDEPTNGLDPAASRQIQNSIMQWSAAGKTILLSTHLLHMAENLCTRVGIIHKGKLQAVGRIEDLRTQLAPEGSLEEVFFAVTQTGEQPGDTAGS